MHGASRRRLRRVFEAMARVSGLPEAASRGYSVVHTWEKAAPLEEEALSTLQKLARAAATRPVPKHVRDAPSRKEGRHVRSDDT